MLYTLHYTRIWLNLACRNRRLCLCLSGARQLAAVFALLPFFLTPRSPAATWEWPPTSGELSWDGVASSCVCAAARWVVGGEAAAVQTQLPDAQPWCSSPLAGSYSHAVVGGEEKEGLGRSSVSSVGAVPSCPALVQLSSCCNLCWCPRWEKVVPALVQLPTAWPQQACRETPSLVTHCWSHPAHTITELDCFALQLKKTASPCTIQLLC